jgi:dTDP-4-dehydrorhamnose 3,5-epimerase
MIFTETRLAGAYLISLEPIEDERGYFARTFAAEEFEANGLSSSVVHCNTSFNLAAGTLRGLHYQAAPYGECKLVRCTRGAIYDVIADLREHSPTYREWLGVELTQDNGLMLYVPEGMAHGFQTLEPRCEVFYQMSREFVPSGAQGIRFDDPGFGIVWPLAITTISERDQSYPDYEQ